MSMGQGTKTRLARTDEERRHVGMRRISEWIGYHRQNGNQLGAAVAQTYLDTLRGGSSAEEARREIVAQAEYMYDQFHEAMTQCQ